MSTPSSEPTSFTRRCSATTAFPLIPLTLSQTSSKAPERHLHAQSVWLQRWRPDHQEQTFRVFFRRIHTRAQRCRRDRRRPRPGVYQLAAGKRPELFFDVRNGRVTQLQFVTTAGQLVAAGLFRTKTFPLINGVTPVPPSTPVFDTVNFSAPFDAGGGVPQNTYNLLAVLTYNSSSRTQMFFRFARYSENDFQGAVTYSPYPQYNTGDTVT